MLEGLVLGDARRTEEEVLAVQPIGEHNAVRIAERDYVHHGARAIAQVELVAHDLSRFGTKSHRVAPEDRGPDLDHDVHRAARPLLLHLHEHGLVREPHLERATE